MQVKGHKQLDRLRLTHQDIAASETGPLDKHVG